MSLRFAHPWLLALLLLPPLLLSLPYLARGRFRPPALRFPDTGRLAELPRSRRLSLLALPGLLRLTGLLLIVLALARPQHGQEQVVVTGEGVSIAIALDVSASMAAPDLDAQTRLDAAREITARFIEARAYDRIGLVLFAGAAYLLSPPTADHTALQRLLDEVRLASELEIESGTALGLGLGAAAGMLQDADGDRVVILLTDGASNAGEIDPLSAAQAAAALGIRVYPIGVGSPDSVDLQVSGLDEALLQQIAAVSEGVYFRAHDRAALEAVFREIDALEPARYEISRSTRYRELMAWFLLPGIVFLLLDFVLSRTLFDSLP